MYRRKLSQGQTGQAITKLDRHRPAATRSISPVVPSFKERMSERLAPWLQCLLIHISCPTGSHAYLFRMHFLFNLLYLTVRDFSAPLLFSYLFSFVGTLAEALCSAKLTKPFFDGTQNGDRGTEETGPWWWKLTAFETPFCAFRPLPLWITRQWPSTCEQLGLSYYSYASPLPVVFWPSCTSEMSPSIHRPRIPNHR